MTTLSLTTDFGNLNGFVGTMKGVIWGIAPDVNIADISHEIPAQDIRTGSIALWRSSIYFPAGSVHVKRNASKENVTEEIFGFSNK